MMLLRGIWQNSSLICSRKSVWFPLPILLTKNLLSLGCAIFMMATRKNNITVSVSSMRLSRDVAVNILEKITFLVLWVISIRKERFFIVL